MTRRSIAPILILVALIAVPVIALAAPARTAILTGAAPVYEWKGPAKAGLTRYVHTVNGATVARGCEQPVTAVCDDTLLKIDQAGATQLVLEVGRAAGTDDFDLYVYESDEAGAAGAAAGSSAEDAPLPEKVTVKAPKKGFYLARIVYFDTGGSAPAGKATLDGLAGGGATATPTANPGTNPTPTPTATATPTATPTASPTSTPTPRPNATPSPQPSRTSGTLTASMIVKSSRLKVARTKGLSVRVTCSVACQGTVALRLDGKTAKALKLGKKAMSIGSGRFALAAKGSRTFSVKFSARAKRALSKARKAVPLTVQAAIRDPKNAQRVTRSRKIKLKR